MSKVLSKISLGEYKSVEEAAAAFNYGKQLLSNRGFHVNLAYNDADLVNHTRDVDKKVTKAVRSWLKRF